MFDGELEFELEGFAVRKIELSRVSARRSHL